MPLDGQVSQMKIPKDAKVLAVCVLGMKRSPTLASILREHDYQNVDFVGASQPDTK